jgi:predicted transcriptional regulator
MVVDEQQQDLTALTVDLLSAFVSNNSVRSDDLPGLIRSTHEALSSLSAAAPEAAVPEAELKAAVSVRKSLSSREHIISMIDGKPYKSLKRHLGRHGLSPGEYRERYNLPASYPMVAPAYSEQRREVAKRLGLGRKGRGAATAADGGSAGGGGRRKKSPS